LLTDKGYPVIGPRYARVFCQEDPHKFDKKGRPVLDPFNHDWYTPMLMGLLALWAGVVSYLRRLVNGAEFTLLTLASHLGSSAFAGFVVALLCQEYDMSIQWTGVCCALSGHMSAEAVKILEDKLREKAERING
jgi:hypothetical protein